jgi:O-antigen ligase
VLIAVSPSSVQRHYLSIFHGETYVDENSTIHTRFVAWEMARDIIKDYPWMGIGYGWRNFEYLDRQYRMVEDLEFSHCHNTWLQAACEAGIPSLLSLLAVWISLLVLLLLGARAMPARSPQRRQFVSLVGLFSGIAIYMLSNYVLRYTSGTLIWILLALALTIIYRTFCDEAVPQESLDIG